MNLVLLLTVAFFERGKYWAICVMHLRFTSVVMGVRTMQLRDEGKFSAAE